MAARRLIESGHQVGCTGIIFQPLAEATGARFVPMVNSLDCSDPQNVPEAWIKQRNSLRGLSQLKFDLRHFFIDAAIGQVKDYSKPILGVSSRCASS